MPTTKPKNELLTKDFDTLRADLKNALKQAIKKKELSDHPDYAHYCDIENYALLKELFNHASDGHSWITFQTAVCKFKGTFVEFMDSKHWQDKIV